MTYFQPPIYRYLHTIQITHGDLTPSNILLTHTYRAKVTDFGQAKFYDNLDRLSPSTVNYSTLKGTRDFMPPELLTDKPLLRVDKDAIDPFSFACVTLFVLTHEWPSPVNKYRCKGNTITKVLTELERREYYIRKLSEEENKQFKHLLEVCLHDNPNMRKKPKWIHDYLKKRCNYDRKVPEHPDRQQDLSTVTVSRDSEWNDTESDVHNETSPTLLAQKSPSVQNGNYCKQHQNKLSLQQNTSTETVAGDSKLSNSEVDEDKRLSSHTTSFNTFNLPPSPPEKSSLVQSSNTYSGQQLRNSADSISLNMYTVIMSIILAVLLAWLTKMSMKYYFF
jgi:serine/threonine protein kinase